MPERARRAKFGNLSSRHAWIAVSVLGGVALAYSAPLAVQAPGEFWGWVNELLATLLSVTAAFLVGVKLYSFQAKDADDRKREDLRSLVRSELAETVTSFGRSTSVPEGDDTEETEPPARKYLVYVQPLILEEAAKSGLLSRDTTFYMLRLASRRGL